VISKHSITQPIFYILVSKKTFVSEQQTLFWLDKYGFSQRSQCRDYISWGEGGVHLFPHVFLRLLCAVGVLSARYHLSLVYFAINLMTGGLPSGPDTQNSFQMAANSVHCHDEVLSKTLHE